MDNPGSGFGNSDMGFRRDHVCGNQLYPKWALNSLIRAAHRVQKKIKNKIIVELIDTADENPCVSNILSRPRACWTGQLSPKKLNCLRRTDP